MAGTSWALAIATYNRPDILRLAVGLAAAQSRPPAEILICDCSANWEETRGSIQQVLDGYPGIRLVYEAALVPSAAEQRNQALRNVTADTVFLFDDDTLMYPGCAEEILAIYDADVHHRVAGIQASMTDQPPGGLALTEARKETGTREVQDRSKLREWLWRHLFLMNSEELFVPYDGRYADIPPPPEVKDMDISLQRLFHGCRMTFRREYIVAEGFEPSFRSYSPGEDLDTCYRVSRHGAMITAHRAVIHHYESAVGRIDRYRVLLLAAANQAVCIRRHASDRPEVRRRYWTLMLRRLLAEFLKDGLSRRWTFPQFRGLLAAMGYARQAFRVPIEDLERWYVPVQGKILGKPV